MGAMYLRRSTRKKGGADYDYWLLVESVRTALGPRQRVVATIGKLPGLDREERIGWEEIGRILSGKPRPTPGLFEQREEPPSWATVNINGVSVERLRSFGDVYLGLLLWNKLGFADFCRDHLPSNREEVPWSIMAAILVLARFCAPSSELQIAEFWYGKTALEDILGIAEDKINEDRLYRALDALLPHKDALCLHLQKRYGELSAAPLTFCSMTSPRPTLKGPPKAMPRQRGVTAVTADPIAPRFVSDWWQRGRGCPWPLKSSTATGLMSQRPKRWFRSWRPSTAKPTGYG